MDKQLDYRDVGLATYGNKCEICSNAMVEVHHIYYQEHQELENKIRKTYKDKDMNTHLALLKEAKEQGWEYFDTKALQLDKGKRSTMLSVLCGNCHTLIHKMDVGMKLLKAISPRK